MEDEFEFQLKAQQLYGRAVPTESEATQTYVDPSDGTVYVWDDAQQGWFPKVDEDFLAAYHASYGTPATVATSATSSGSGESSTAAPSALVRDDAGFLIPPIPASRSTQAQSLPKDQVSSTPTTSASVKRSAPQEDPKQQEDTKKKKPNEKQTPQWFEMDEEKNQNVYVSGLPLDVTLEEFTELMKKCGIIAENDDGDLKIKLYKDSDGSIKGDGLCCYLKKESIVLAIQLLDGSQIRGHTISVQKAKFALKGEYNPALKKKKKKKKKGNKQEKLLDWRERRNDGNIRKKQERIIVFRNVFDPKEFDDDPTLITDIKEDLNEECSKFGTVKKILIFDRHPEGIASVAFAEFEAADMCIARMDQRWYGGHQLAVSQWDGLTNFQVEETDQEREQRLEKWEKFIAEDAAEGKGDIVEGDNTGSVAEGKEEEEEEEESDDEEEEEKESDKEENVGQSELLHDSSVSTRLNDNGAGVTKDPSD